MLKIFTAKTTACLSYSEMIFQCIYFYSENNGLFSGVARFIIGARSGLQFCRPMQKITKIK